MSARTAMQADTLWCSGCHNWKPDGEFLANGRREDRRGRMGTCEKCVERKRAYRSSDEIIVPYVAPRPPEMQGRAVPIFTPWPSSLAASKKATT